MWLAERTVTLPQLTASAARTTIAALMMGDLRARPVRSDWAAGQN